MTAQETAPWLFDESHTFSGDDRFGSVITFETSAPTRREQKWDCLCFTDKTCEWFVTYERIAPYCQVDLYFEGRFLRTFYAASDSQHKVKLAAEQAFGFQIDCRITRICDKWQSPA